MDLHESPNEPRRRTSDPNRPIYIAYHENVWEKLGSPPRAAHQGPCVKRTNRSIRRDSVKPLHRMANAKEDDDYEETEVWKPPKWPFSDTRKVFQPDSNTPYVEFPDKDNSPTENVSTVLLPCCVFCLKINC